MARVLMVASEASPFAKSGGLADMVGGLAPALRAQGDEVAVVIPRYRSTKSFADRCVAEDVVIRLGPSEYRVGFYETRYRDVTWLFVDCPAMFDREGLYGRLGQDYEDIHVRFAVLCKAALHLAGTTYRASIIHAHDWQAGLVPVYVRGLGVPAPAFSATRLVFTVHNLGYQGDFPRSALAEVGLDESLFNPGALEFWGRVNLLKGGVVFSDAVTTVSPAYAREIQTAELGFGLDGVFRERSAVLYGIVNGVDYGEWDPETDHCLPARYSDSDLAGKSVCKRELLREVGLSDDSGSAPLTGMVSRFAKQKGFDILIEALPSLLERGSRLMILGSGDAEAERALRSVATRFPGRLAVVIGFDNGLAHRITAGADIFLMPSRYEPCGLNQMYALRYGTVPVVRATGGLDDTVDDSVGFKFEEYSAAALVSCLGRAEEHFRRNRDAWLEMARRGMRKDYSWNHTARAYSRLYRSLLGQ